ncbi:MAG TPA: hypothetical protein VF101_11410 [Gaiellaceae bacterium]
MRRPLQALVVAALLVASPATAARSTAPASGAGNGCTAAATKALVYKFARYYSDGRVAAADRLWPQKPRFRWFSTGPPGERFGPPAYVRSTLAAYFRSRVRVHERIRVAQLRALYSARRKVVDFQGKLVRSADDLPARAPQVFKGAADCVAGRPTLIVWSM